MAFTYDLGSSDAATLRLSKVRLLIPDNDSDSYYLQDAEINYFLSEVGNAVLAAAVKACKWLARKYSQKVTFSADGMSMQHSQRAEVFAKRAAELEAEMSGAWSSVDVNREDGFSEAATDSEYESRYVYITV